MMWRIRLPFFLEKNDENLKKKIKTMKEKK